MPLCVGRDLLDVSALGVQGELLVIDTLNNVYFLPCGDLCLSEATPSPIHSSSSLEPATGTETSSATDVEYTYLGCFDDAETRVLTGTLSADSSMTTQVGMVREG